MSTKVYRAYRVPVNHLNDEIHRVEEIVETNAKGEIQDLVDAADDDEYDGLVDKLVEVYDLTATEDPLLRFRAGLHIFIHEEWAYLWPYGTPGRDFPGLPTGMGLTREECQNLPPYAEPYAFQNSTDPPESVRQARNPIRAAMEESIDESRDGVISAGSKAWDWFSSIPFEHLPPEVQAWHERKHFWHNIADEEAKRLDYTIFDFSSEDPYRHDFARLVEDIDFDEDIEGLGHKIEHAHWKQQRAREQDADD